MDASPAKRLEEVSREWNRQMILIDIVHELRKASGSNAKLDILRQHKQNTMWKRFLFYTYNEAYTYGVSAPSTIDFDRHDIDDNMFSALDDLRTRKYTGNAAKDLAKNLSSAYGEIPRLILGRSIKAGVSVTSINKIYPDLIPVFETMKGVDTPIKEYPVLSSVKFDGVKIFVTVNSGEVTVQTSSGAVVPEFHSLVEDMKSGANGVYEGELIHNYGRQIDRPVITGKLNSLLSGKIEDITDYKFMVYDYIPLDEWEDMEGTTSFIDRQSMLDSIFEMNLGDSMYVKFVQHEIHKTEEEVVQYFDKLIVEGFEGSMHRYPSDPYMFTGNKRTKRLIKKKSIREAVVTCVGTVPHSNPSKGVTGSLDCEGYVNDKVMGRVFVKVNVGSGLSKFEIMQDSDYFIGKKVEILYNCVTAVGSEHSLFLPRFKRIEGSL
jgi:ATP-dependent DNA ligase